MIFSTIITTPTISQFTPEIITTTMSQFTPEIITAAKAKIAQIKPPHAGTEIATDQELLRCVRPISHPSWMNILSHTCDTCNNPLITVHTGNTPPEMRIQCDACNTFITDTVCVGCIHCGVDVCLPCITQVEVEKPDHDESD